MGGTQGERGAVNPTHVARRAVREYGALQKVGELSGFLALLMTHPPEVVVEVGCDAGGTLWAWRQIGAKRVIGVNLPGGDFRSGKPLERHGAEVVAGDSHDLETVEKLEKQLNGQPVDLLFIDGDHTFEGVKQDFLLYAPFVRPEGLIAFHDICHHPHHPDVHVDDFWAALQGRKEEIVTEPAIWGGIGVLQAHGAYYDEGLVTGYSAAIDDPDDRTADVERAQALYAETHGAVSA